MGALNTREDLPGIDVPMLVIGGAHDPITLSGPRAERIASLIPGAELTVVEGSAHSPFITEKAAFLTTWKVDLKR